MNRFARTAPFVSIFVALALLLLWDASGLDLVLARAMGTPQGFPLRDSATFVLFMHKIPRDLSWAVLAILVLLVRWPVGPLRQLDRADRWQLAVSALLSVLLVSLIKHGSRTSCPWDLTEFGGIARYVSHWQWGVSDGGPGGCFPAGHASAAFAYVGGWFVLRKVSARLAAFWLIGAVALGLLLGLGQQWRGAHYMSHTLWTAWLCWTLGWAVDGIATLRRRKAAWPSALADAR